MSSYTTTTRPGALVKKGHLKTVAAYGSSQSACRIFHSFYSLVYVCVDPVHCDPACFQLTAYSLYTSQYIFKSCWPISVRRVIANETVYGNTLERGFESFVWLLYLRAC